MYVKICYEEGVGFSFITSNGSANKISCDYLLDASSLRNKIQVMDVHSHNTMPAIFSVTDDQDEIYPGVFGVIGNLDKEDPTMSIRVGYNGIFRNCLLSDFFGKEV